MTYATINIRKLVLVRVIFNFSKTLMVLLICVAFVGQAMASTIMSYQMTGMSAQQPSHDMYRMAHSSHSIASVPSSEGADEDCCVKAWSCFTGGCVSALALIEDTNNESIINFSTKIHSISSLAQSQQLLPLYRPPILS